jgi:hypothetical protein
MKNSYKTQLMARAKQGRARSFYTISLFFMGLVFVGSALILGFVDFGLWLGAKPLLTYDASAVLRPLNETTILAGGLALGILVAALSFGLFRYALWRHSDDLAGALFAPLLVNTLFMAFMIAWASTNSLVASLTMFLGFTLYFVVWGLIDKMRHRLV